MSHQAPGHVSPKNVDIMNRMKNKLSHYVEKISKTETSSPSYQEYRKKIKDLLTNLLTIEINVGTLHATKIGKLMSKCERQLNGELSDLARENNSKWKGLLSEYRENFKKRAFCRDDKIKEEPLSQDSYNNLVASQDVPDCFSENSCNQILANSQDFSINENEFPKEPELSSSNGSDDETESDDELNNDDNNDNDDNNNGGADCKGRGNSSFFIDMRNTVTEVTSALSSVEMECTRIRTMLEYINNKLDDHEEMIEKKDKKRKKAYSKVGNGHVNSPGNIDIRGSFKKTGRAVMPNLLSPSSTSGKSAPAKENTKGSSMPSTSTVRHSKEPVTNTEVDDMISNGGGSATSNNCSEDDTMLYATVKEEDPQDDSQDVEFYFHREKKETRTEASTTLTSVASNTEKDRSNSPQETANKSDNSHIHTLNEMNKKREKIIKKLNSNSAEKKTKGLRIENVQIQDKTVKIRRPMEEGDCASSKKQFEVDSDGFTVPNCFGQNVLNTSGNIAIIKGQQVEEDIGVNLDEIELEDMFTFSQTVSHSDDLDEVEKDYLLRDKKKNRSRWNNNCKSKEGVRYPLLMKSDGRMKAAHKASTGKKVLKDMLNKKLK